MTTARVRALRTWMPAVTSCALLCAPLSPVARGDSGATLSGDSTVVDGTAAVDTGGVASTSEEALSPAAEAPGASRALAAGERLTFSIRYGAIRAGEAVLELVGTGHVGGRPAWRARAEASSSAVFDKVYPVRDRWESWMELDSLWCLQFEKHLREGRYRKDLAMVVDHTRGIATYHDGREVEVPRGVHDVLSAFYFVRTAPLTEGATFYLESHENRKNYPLRVTVKGREELTTELGTFDCWVVEPTLASGAFFKNDGRLTIWLTDDDRRIPVQMRSKIPVGSITAVLTSLERPAAAMGAAEPD